MATPPQKPLSKTCSSCGLIKPLAAFLQMAGSVGAIYGNICSTCRKANIDKAKSPSVDEGSSTSSTGNKIDAKTKVKTDIDKKLLREYVEDLHQEEREDKQEAKDIRSQKIKVKAEKELKHREGYLKKGSVFDSKSNANATSSADKQFFATDTARKTIDYTKHTGDTQRHTGQTKYQTAFYNTLQAWLGKNTNAAKNIEKMGLANKVTSPKNPGKK
jgi:DNA-binding protein H-NS